jgi:Protein of unknown function (DUF1616)
MSLVLPHPGQTGMTRRARRLWFFTLYVAGCASVNTATGYAGYPGAAPLRVPHAVEIVLGLLMVFVVPGLSAVFAALPECQSWLERLLASVGISVAVATLAVVLLAATPMGFSRQPFGELLGGVTVVLSVGGLYRSRLAAAVWVLRARINKLPIVKPHVAVKQRGAQRLNNFAKSARSQQDTEADVRRSVVVLNFSFNGKPVDPGA